MRRIFLIIVGIVILIEIVLLAATNRGFTLKQITREWEKRRTTLPTVPDKPHHLPKHGESPEFTGAEPQLWRSI